MKETAGAKTCNGLHEKTELFVTTKARTSNPANCIRTFKVMRLGVTNFKTKRNKMELKNDIN
jgi:hypothetical protein